MCNLTAPPSHHPAAKRHQSGTTAALKRSRTAKSASPQRTKCSKIRYLCAPNCGIWTRCRHNMARLAAFLCMKSQQTRATNRENIVILATWMMHNFSCPKFYLALPFSPPGPAWPPFPFPQDSVGDYSGPDAAWRSPSPEKSSSWAARVPTPVLPPAVPSR